MTWAEEIRQAREELGLSQNKAALELGIPRDTISDYERGRRKPKEPRLSLINDYYGIDCARCEGESDAK